MVGMFYVGQEIRRTRTTAPLPTPAPLVERAGDVEIGGVHLLEFHWNTLIGGSGFILLVLGVVVLTYCCMKGLLQQCCLNSCVLCCPANSHGGGGDVEAQWGREDQGQSQAVATAPTPSAPTAVEGAGSVEMCGRFQRSLEDILAAHRAKARRCGICQGVGHSYSQCPSSAESMM